MVREYILLFLVLMTKCALCTVNNSQNLLSSDNQKRIINKCCPDGKYVGIRKSCVNISKTLNFSQTEVYTEDIYDTGRSIEDVFNIISNKFEDKKFKVETIDVHMLDYFNMRVIESGVLLLENPNSYQRWIQIQPDDYCVDYRITRNPSSSRVLKPRFWVILPNPSEHSSTIPLTSATFVSCFFLLLVLMVYTLLPELRNLSGVILMAYVISLFMAFLLLGIIQTSQYTKLSCIYLTMGIYFFFLTSFFWMNIMAFDVWWTIRGFAKGRHIHRRGERFKFLMYCLYAFGVPLLMTIGLLLLNSYSSSMRHLPWFVTPHVPEYGCFLEGGVKLLYLYVPMLILIVINCVFYLMTAFNVWRLKRKLISINTVKTTGISQVHCTQKQRFMDYLKLSVMMGLNWVLEILSFLYPDLKCWFISDIYNILIGLVLFIIFICNKKVFNSLRDRFRRRKTMHVPPVKYSCTSVATIDSAEN